MPPTIWPAICEPGLPCIRQSAYWPIARQTDAAILAAMPGGDWRGLIRMRVLLAHIPWRVQSERVWYAVTVSVPALYAELQRYRGVGRE